MKIYTGGGDRGKTSLFSGSRVTKNNIRIRANGDLDELGSWLGLVESRLTSDDSDISSEIRRIQAELLECGAWLSTPPDSPHLERLVPVYPEKAEALERTIDQMETELEPLTAFLLAGGDEAAATAHVARTVCRRAERSVVAVVESEGDDTRALLNGVLMYINRLSDYLFVLARLINKRRGVRESFWQS